MIVQMPDGERRNLDNVLPIEDKCIIVEGILIEFEEYIESCWFNQKVVYLLNGLSNYLIWHRDEEIGNRHDKYVLSKRKTVNLKKYDDKNIPFSSLTKSEKKEIGLIDMEDLYND